ncbi:MAG TPA: LacI family DNA-binding transcriptional regulator [Bacteroidota bacterium]
MMAKGVSLRRRVTVEEVAHKAGLSAMTVSRVLNNQPNVSEKTRRRVLDISRRLGYTPNQIAKSLVTRKTETIGVVVPEITHSFFPEAIRGIEEISYRLGYHLILMHSAEDVEREAEAIRMLEEKRVDGILISVAQTATDHCLYRELVRQGMPVVFFDRCVSGIGASCVSIDDEESARRITDHLLGHGYRQLAHLSGPAGVSIGAARLKGFRAACRKAACPVPDELVVESGFHESGGYEAMQRLLDLPVPRRPRAVVAINDPAAFGAMKAILERGLQIPDDIAIAGFSDDIRSELMPSPLTTIRQPAYEVGRRAAQQLFAEIDGISESAEHTVKADMVIRRSCGCRPQK